MAQPGSEAAHDERLAALLGAAAATVLHAPVKYTTLERPESIAAALSEGSVCRVQAPSARILIYLEDGYAKALVTELAHAGYRRRYRAFAEATVEQLTQRLKGTYSSR